MRHLLLALSIFPFIAHAQPQPNPPKKTTALYQVGYENIVTKDSSRNYKPGAPYSNALYRRPIEIDLWYPAAAPGSNSPIEYGEWLDLLEQRSNRFQDDTVFKVLTQDLLQYICANLKISDTAKLDHLKTKSYRNAIPIREKFPLILYMCAYNGMSYENIHLFEQLAAHGYVVASITSVGKYPGNMSTRPADLMEQVNDGAFAMNYLSTGNNVDVSRIGIMGYSWGGLAALVLVMNNPDIKAILSLDGSEMHYYGESAEEDKDFDDLRTSPVFRRDKVNIPYTYLESGTKQSDRQVDSIFNILPSLSAPKNYIHFPRATHEDFSCLPSLATQILGTKNNAADLYNQFTEITINYFDQCLKGRPGGLSAQVSSIFRQHQGDSLYPVVNSSLNANGPILKGKIIDFDSKDMLAYVNVGIPEKNIGTVSANDGAFTIRGISSQPNDSLRFSMAGYTPLTVSIAALLRQQQPVLIPLRKKISELEQVLVISKSLPTKTKGNTTTSNFISIGLPLKFMGSETGIKLSLGKKPVVLKRFNFNISENRLDTAVFRLNVYNFKNGIPYENILRQNILVPIGQQKGKYSIDLSDYRILLQGDVLISLEWIKGSSSGRDHGAIFLSAGFLNSATWHRLTSQGQWKKASGLGVGFNAVVQTIKN